MTRIPRKPIAILVGAAAVLAPLAALASPAAASTVPTSCTRYVTPGAPAGDGTTPGSPMSLASLVSYANAGPRPGLVACLDGGSYGSATAEFNLRRGGDPTGPVSIVRNPATGTDPVISGRLVVARGANNVVISKLKFVGPGAGTQSAFSIDANNVELIGNDFSSPNRICISVGGGIRAVSATLPKVTGFVADGNKVHDCGTNLAKTGSPQAHGFYLEYSQGAVVRNNLISNPVGRGVQLFNDADASLIENNIFDHNFAAVNFGGGTGGSSAVDPRPENNIVRNNIVTNGVRWCNTDNVCQRALFVQGNHEAAYVKPASTDPQTKAGATWGNVVGSNCVFLPNAAEAVAYNDWEPGYRYESTNTAVDPQYSNSAAGDFRLKPTSPCLGKGVRPAVRNVSAVASANVVTAKAVVRSPWMTASHRLQVRLCNSAVTSTASTTPCTGNWINGSVASVIGTDVSVTQGVAGLLANRIYEYRSVTWQALQAAPGSSVDYNASTQYWTASAPLKIKTTG
ncbi:MAG TPA: right-handed parallel beta-helix repeat-containing protein [Acidimicrobiales bacterium]|nr:right-handed parallel beta-helix repeat-containing protein [Acidimicrobiales bacterium]